MYILDTSAILEILHNSKTGNEIVEIIEGFPTLTTVFSIHEVLFSIKEKEVEKVNQIFEEGTIINFDKKSAIESAKIERELKTSGNMINKVDIFIAGICKNHNLEIITTDKDFLKVKDLKVKLI